MSLLDSIRAAKRFLDEAEVAASSGAATAEHDSAKVDRLEGTVASLRDANALLRAQLGQTTDDQGGPVARALRAAAILVHTKYSAAVTRPPMLWLKACGWGEGGNGHYTDPQTHDTFSLENAVSIQARRDLDPFKALVSA